MVEYICKRYTEYNGETHYLLAVNKIGVLCSIDDWKKAARFYTEEDAWKEIKKINELPNIEPVWTIEQIQYF